MARGATRRPTRDHRHVANARYDGVRGEVPRQTFVSLGGMRMEVVRQLTVYAAATAIRARSWRRCGNRWPASIPTS